jgi:AsmA family protein
MRRALKIIGGAVAGIVVLLLLAAGALWLGGPPVVAWAVEHPLSAYLGRQIRLGGPLRLVWGVPTKIIAEDVHVANAPWSSDAEMFSAKRLEIEVFAPSLLSGPTRLPLISLDGATLLLEKAKDGQKNWNFGLSSAAPQQRHQFPLLTRLDVRNAALVYRNDVTGARTELGLTRLSVTENDPQAPVRIDAAGTFQKAPIRLGGSVGSIAALRNTNQPYPVKLSGGLDRIRLDLDGTIKRPLGFDGVDLRVSLAGAKLDELAGMLGVSFPALPDFRGTAKLTGGDAHFALTALTVKAGNSDLEGGIEMDFTGKVPALTAHLTSSYIDLADFKGMYGGTPEKFSAPEQPANSAKSSGRLLPDTKLAVNKLPGFNAELSFDGTRIKSYGGVPFERVTLGLRVKDGELWVDPLRFQLAQGDVDLNLHFTPFTRDTPPQMQAEIDVRHVDLHQLLGRPTMPQMLQKTAGIVGGFVKVNTTGVSTRQFLARMDGDAGFFMENGQVSQLLEQLTPIDVLSALGVYLGGDRPVPINCLVSRFAIKQGVATATTLIVDTDADTIVGKGNANFADETLFLDFDPYNKHLRLVSLRTPVEVRGTFAKPTFQIESGKLIQRIGEALGLGVLFPPAALVPLIDTGLGHGNACAKAYAAQHAPGNPAPKSGSSMPLGTTQRAPPH